MNWFSKILSALIVSFLFVPLVNGANDPGHDSLYIERAGDNVSGTFNFSGTFYVPSPGSAMEAATRQYVDDTVNAANDSIWNQSGSDIYYDAGNVGIGTDNPGSALDVNGSVEAGTNKALYLNDSSGNLGLGTTPDVPLHLEFTGNDTDAGGGGQGVFFIDAEESSIDTEPLFRVNVPSSGDRKAFQLGMQGKSWSWASFSFTAGPNNKPGFMLGNAQDSRDVGVFRQGTNNLRLYDDVSVSGDLDLLSDNISNVGNITASGTIEANRFVGDGSGLTNISSSGGSLWTNSSGDVTYTGGNVGIGTTSPSTKLGVDGGVIADSLSLNSTSYPQLELDTDAESNLVNALSVSDADGNDVVSIGTNKFGEGKLRIQDSSGNQGGDLSYGERGFKIVSDQAVRIPNSNFQVEPRVSFGNSNNNPPYDATLNAYGKGSDPVVNLFDSDKNKLLTVEDSGNVGIGTTSPSSLLDVSGTAQASTSFQTGSLTLHNSDGLYRGNDKRASVRFGSQKANGARPLILTSGANTSYTGGEININVDGEKKTKINSTDTKINNDVNVNGSVTLDPDGSKPSCTSSNAGEMWFDDRNGSNGNDDLLYTCMENSTAGHNWVLVARGG